MCRPITVWLRYTAPHAVTTSMTIIGTGYSDCARPSEAFATRVSGAGRRMLSAPLTTNAMPRRIHIVPSVMMNGCTRRPTTISPLTAPQIRPTDSDTARPSATVAAAPDGSTARSTIAIATPASAYTEPTERSIPPEMITIVAPTAMTAKKLASVAV